MVLQGSLVLFGVAGVEALSAPRGAVSRALAATFAFAASARFARTREDLVATVPGTFPIPGSW